MDSMSDPIRPSTLEDALAVARDEVRKLEAIAARGDLNDVRSPPDKGGKTAFLGGWTKALKGGKPYTAKTLRRLTWHNLGYRLAQVLGPVERAWLDSIYASQSQQWQIMDAARKPINLPSST